MSDKQEKTVHADIAEGGAKIRNNKGFSSAIKNLKDTFNPEAPRALDAVAHEFLDRNVFREKNGVGELVYPAGCYVSNIELDHIKNLEEQFDQDKYRKAVRDAGFTDEVEEAEVDAQVIA